MLYNGTGLCVILVNVLVNSTKFPISCDTLYVASVAEKFTGATLALVACNFSYTLIKYVQYRSNILRRNTRLKYKGMLLSL